MIQSGHGRPLRAFALAALVFLSAFLALTSAASAAARYGNVVDVAMPRPDADEVVLSRIQIQMELRRGRVAAAPLGSLAVRRAGGSLPRGYSVVAVRAKPKGSRVTVRLAAVRTSGAARAGRSLRLKLRVGTARVAYRRAVTWTVPIAPNSRIRRERDCATINGEATRWTPVRGLAALRLEGRRFGARTAVGAAQEMACRRTIPAVSGTEAFLTSVDPDFADGGGGGSVEGFYATWAKDAAGNAKICVYVRGDRGGSGDVRVGTTTQPFTLDDDRGVTRVDTAVPGEGEYEFTVRWRQPDGTFRDSTSTLRVPGGGTRGNDPPAPYAAAGPCA